MNLNEIINNILSNKDENKPLKKQKPEQKKKTHTPKQPIKKIDPYKYPNVTYRDDGTFTAWTHDYTVREDPKTITYEFKKPSKVILENQNLEELSKNMIMPKLTIEYLNTGTQTEIMKYGKQLFVKDTNLKYAKNLQPQNAEELIIVSANNKIFSNANNETNKATRQLKSAISAYTKLFNTITEKFNVEPPKSRNKKFYK